MPFTAAGDSWCREPCCPLPAKSLPPLTPSHSIQNTSRQNLPLALPGSVCCHTASSELNPRVPQLKTAPPRVVVQAPFLITKAAEKVLGGNARAFTPLAPLPECLLRALVSPAAREPAAAWISQRSPSWGLSSAASPTRVTSSLGTFHTQWLLPGEGTKLEGDTSEPLAKSLSEKFSQPQETCRTQKSEPQD